MATNRVAGILALGLSALIGIATLAHAVQLVATIAQGSIASTATEVRDGVVIFTRDARPGGVYPESVIAGFATDATILAVVALLIVILNVSLLPLVAGLTIVVLAFVFRAGARIQNDTEGLV